MKQEENENLLKVNLNPQETNELFTSSVGANEELIINKKFNRSPSQGYIVNGTVVNPQTGGNTLGSPQKVKSNNSR